MQTYHGSNSLSLVMSIHSPLPGREERNAFTREKCAAFTKGMYGILLGKKRRGQRSLSRSTDSAISSK